jgi:uncharacterized protein YggU (UPF0235/DUF167 family)
VLLEWVLALEALAVLILSVMWLIGLVLGRLKDKEDHIAIFVHTFWNELLWPPEVMPADSTRTAGKSSGRGTSSSRGYASQATEEDEFYGRIPKAADGRTAKVDLDILVVPNAASDAVLGRDGDGLRLQVTGEPGDSRSNKALIELVANAVGVKPYQVTLTKGHYHPRKTVQIQGISQDDLQAVLANQPEAE